MENTAPQNQPDSAATPIPSTRTAEHGGSLDMDSTLNAPLLSNVACTETLQARIAELEVSLEHREREIHAMRRTSEALFQHNSVDSMVRQTLNTALEVLGAEAGSLQLYDAEQDSLVFRYVA